MHHHGLRPAPWHRTWLAATALLLAATGAAWLALHYSVGAGTGELPHPAEAWLMKLHGAAAFAALFGGGLVAGHHLPAAWRAAQRPRHAAQRRSGVLLCGSFALAVLTGYALYYFAPESLRATLGWAHAGIAVLAIGLGGWHGAQRRRRRQGLDPA
jgi:hypothetical protein